MCYKLQIYITGNYLCQPIYISLICVRKGLGFFKVQKQSLAIANLERSGYLLSYPSVVYLHFFNI